MKKKVLFTATITKHINVFHLPYLEWFKKNGFEVHVASNGIEEIPFCDKFINIPFERAPYKTANLKAYIKLQRLISKEKYDIIHCHTPIGGVITRLAAITSRRNGTKVIYTAHGFHFFKGSKLINWKIYYPIEKLLSKYTDTLITINAEDFNIAKEEKFNSKSIVLVNGVGIDSTKFQPAEPKVKKTLRADYGYDNDDYIMIYVGELSYRKHQDLLIEVVALLKNEIPNIKLLLVGTGHLQDIYKKQVNKLNIQNYVDFLGYRTDINRLMKLADVAVSSSRQEGLPVNIMEAMATGLPAIVTDCRGNRDLIVNEENGFVVKQDDVESFSNSVLKINSSSELTNFFVQNNLTRIKEFDVKEVEKSMENIYSQFC